MRYHQVSSLILMVASAVFLVGSDYAATVLSDKPTSYYRFEEEPLISNNVLSLLLYLPFRFSIIITYYILIRIFYIGIVSLKGPSVQPSPE